MQPFHVLLHYHNVWKLIFTQQQGKKIQKPFLALLQLQHISLGSSNTCLSITCSHCQECHELCRAFFRSQGILSRTMEVPADVGAPVSAALHHHPGPDVLWHILQDVLRYNYFNLLAKSPKRDNFFV